MKKATLLLTMAMFFGSMHLIAQNYVVNVSESMLKWTGEKVTGKHFGTIALASGEYSMKEGRIVSGNFIVDMNSIANEDVENETYRNKLLGHLKSEDFFNVEKYPTSQFKITGATPVKGGTSTIKGELTIKGITQPVEFKAILQETDKGTKVYGNIIVDRTLFDIRYGSGSFFDNLGDKTIYDEFTIKLDVLASAR